LPSGTTFHPFQAPAHAIIRNDSHEWIALKHGEVTAGIASDGGYHEDDACGEYVITTVDKPHRPIVKALLHGLVDLELVITK
jgi:hypothetical protein